MFRLIMRFKILVIFMLFTSLAYAEKLPEIRGLDRAFSIQENDGSPILYDCRMLSVDNGTLTDNADGSATFSIAGFADNVYLKLDQTTPQTVINGIPIMQEGLTIGDASTYLTFDEVTAPNSLLTNTYNQITSYSNSGTENPIYFPNGIFIENSPTTYYDIVGDGSILATFNIADLVTLSADPSGGGFYANAAMYVLANRTGTIDDYAASQVDVSSVHYFKLDNDATYSGNNDLGIFNVALASQLDLQPTINDATSDYIIIGYAQQATLIDTMPAETVNSLGVILAGLNIQVETISSNRTENAFINGIRLSDWDIRAGDEASTYAIYDETGYDWLISSTDTYIQFNNSNSKIGAVDANHLDLIATETIDMHAGADANKYVTFGKLTNGGSVYYTAGTYPEIKVYNDDTTRPDMLYLDGSLAIEDTLSRVPADNFLEYGVWTKHEHTGSWTGSPADKTALFGGIRIESYRSGIITDYGTGCKDITHGEYYMINNTASYQGTSDGAYIVNYGIMGDCLSEHFYNSSGHSITNINVGLVANVETDTTESQGTMDTYNVCFLGVLETKDMDISNGSVLNAGLALGSLDGTTPPAWNIKAGQESNTFGIWDSTAYDWKLSSLDKYIQFYDSSIKIGADDDGHLDLFADTSIDLNPHASRSISVTDYTFSITSDNYPALAPTSDGVLGDVLFVDGGFLATDTRVTADMLNLGGFYLGIGSSFTYSYTADVSSTDGFAIFYNENLAGTRSGTVSSYSGTYGENFINLQSDYINEATYSGGSAIIYNVSINAAVENDITLNNASSDFTIANEGISIGLISSETITNANSYTITNTCLTGTIDTSDSDGDANTVNKIIDIGNITTSSTHNASIYDNTGNNWYLKADNAALRFGDGNTSSGIENDGDVEIKYTGTNWDYDIRIATTAIRFNPSQFDTDFEVYGDSGLIFTANSTDTTLDVEKYVTIAVEAGSEKFMIVDDFGYNTGVSMSGTLYQSLQLQCRDEHYLVIAEANPSTAYDYVQIKKALILDEDTYVAEGKNIYFDSTDTYIGSNTDDPEDLIITADQDVHISPDNGTTIGDGGTTNYSKFDSSGVLTFYGSAQRGFKIRPALDLTSTLAGGTPTEVTRGANRGYSMPIWSTPANQNEELYFRLQIPQRWDGTTDPQVGVYVSLGNGVEDVGDKFQFQLSWATSNCGGSDTVSTTVSSVTSEQTVITGGTAAYTGYCIWFTLDTDDANNPLASGNMLTARLRRVAATANEVTNEPVVWDWTTSWKQDKVGGTWSVEENVS